MKRLLIILVAVTVALASVGCSDPRTDAVDNLRSFYEELSTNSEYYTSEDWEAIMTDYAYNDSILNSYQYTPEEQQEIDELRGRCSAYLLKGAAKEVGNEFKKAVEGFGNFMNGLLDEFDKGNNNK